MFKDQNSKIIKINHLDFNFTKRQYDQTLHDIVALLPFEKNKILQIESFGEFYEHGKDMVMKGINVSVQESYQTVSLRNIF